MLGFSNEFKISTHQIGRFRNFTSGWNPFMYLATFYIERLLLNTFTDLRTIQVLHLTPTFTIYDNIFLETRVNGRELTIIVELLMNFWILTHALKKRKQNKCRKRQRVEVKTAGTSIGNDIIPNQLLFLYLQVKIIQFNFIKY